MTLLYYDPKFLEHQTGRHPERPERLSQTVRHLERTGLWDRAARPAWLPASGERLTRVHHPDYLDHLQRFAAAGGGRIETDTVMSAASYDVACLAAGAACDAAERIVRGEDKTALCLVRPPGHHALAEGAMGFCLLNHAAIAARTAIAELGVNRVLIVDWDVHHGNGTQDIFWEDPAVGYLSIHRWPFYPDSGAAGEIGGSAGRGMTRNVPIEFGTSREDYMAAFRAALTEFADHVRPELVIVSAGFDAHRDDPIGSLGLETEDFATLTRLVIDVAKEHAGGRVLSLLEGGYNCGALAGCVEVHLRELGGWG
ncbi:MAG: histone deacetylase [Planctomycetia bacterium]|nr:histone deacetylase [Planctomycetia bacterium]